jgi:peptide/nickel transport system substrate-binding protein
MIRTRQRLVKVINTSIHLIKKICAHLRTICVYPRPLFLLTLTLLAACNSTPTSTTAPIIVSATPGQVGITVGKVTSQAPFTFDVTNTPPDPLATPSPPTAVPYKTLTVCMSAEPQSLYAYSVGDHDSVWARDIVLETLRDGPLDHRNFAYQPVLLDKLPSLKDGDASIEPVQVAEGGTVIDVSGNITTLAPNVHYFDADGVEQVYSGGGSAAVMQLSVTFKLKAGVLWEDGSPLTADDILFSWQVAKDPATTAADHYLPNRTNDPVVVDSQTLTLTFLPGFKDPLYYTRLPIPLPRHLYSNLTPAQMAASDLVNRRPISFGPYILNDWAPGDHLTVVKNPSYYRAGEGLPHIDQINFQFVPDPQQMVMGMASGFCQLGLAPQDTFFATQNETMTQASQQGFFYIQSVPSTTFEHLDFNISPAANYRGVAGIGLFQDVRIRTAFAYCIDRDSLIDSLMSGRGDVPATYVPPNHPYYNPKTIKGIPFDPEKGKALFKEAGWQDTNGDGLLDKKGRLSLDYVFGPTDNVLRRGIAIALQTQLKDNCGIEILPRELSRFDLFGDFPDGVLFGRQFDLGQFSWVGGQADPSCGLYTRNEWTGIGDGQPDQYGQVGYPGGGNNVGYLNPTFDDLCLRALASLDPQEKASLHQQALGLFAEEVPSIILFFKPKLALIRPNVSGFSLDTTQDSVLWNVEEMDLTP